MFKIIIMYFKGFYLHFNEILLMFKIIIHVFQKDLICI